MPRERAVGFQRGVTCKYGHDEWQRDPRNRGHRCLTCRRNRYSPDRGEVCIQKGGPMGATCSRGHDDWYVYSNGYKRCWHCKNGHSSASGLWSKRRIDEHGNRHHDVGEPRTLLWDTLTREEVMRARAA